jgi:hypothetical protein
MKSPRRIKIIDRKLGKERAVGQAHHGDNLIEIDPRQRSRDRLDTVCHEVIHLLGPHLSEEIVISHANILSDALWRDRWRRIEN